MGITIHYSGIFRNDRSLSEMIEEATAFAESEGWKADKQLSEFNNGSSDGDPDNRSLFGVLLHPPECETVFLCFEANRKLGYYFDFSDCITETWIPDNGPDGGHWERDESTNENETSWFVHTKTQYAGSAVHRKVVQLLRIVSEKYLTEFNCEDETGYWQHGDESELMKRFGEIPDEVIPGKKWNDN